MKYIVYGLGQTHNQTIK